MTWTGQLKIRGLWAVAIASLLAGGCANAPREAGVMKLAQAADPFTLDPARAYDTTSIPMTRLMYRGLVDYGPKNELIDEVAQSHKVSADGKTYTFKLRPNVYFHSGRRVTADDFRYAIERVMDPATESDGLSMYGNIVGAEAWSADRSSATPKLKNMSGIDVPDDDTIIFHLVKPDATFLNLLTLPFTYAVPRDYVEDLKSKGLTLSDHPNGCGPFKFREWVHDAWVKLDKNPKYFRPGIPKADSIELQCSINATLNLMLFEQGKVDVIPISDAYPPEFLRITQSPKWKPVIAHAPMMDLRYVTLNNTMAPFNDKRVRQAVNYGVDRERIASFLSGRAVVARGPLPPGMPAYDPHRFQYPFNPQKAKELLKQANYKPDPAHPITLWYSESETWYEKAAQSIKSNLDDIGIPIQLSKLRYGELKTLAGKPDGCHMAILGWLMDYPDPSNFLDILYNKKSIQKSASLNRAFYSNPKVDKLLDDALVETNPKKRISMYQAAEKQIVDDAPVLFMVHTERYVVHQPWVEGYRLSPMWATTYENLAVKP